jgi:hypothetical protein
MPTVFRDGPYRFFFYSCDKEKPQHVHVEREDRVAKFWLNPVRLQRSGGFSRTELVRIQKVISRCQDELMEVWNEYFHS